VDDLVAQQIVDEAGALFRRLADLPEDSRIDAINQIRLALREHSPMRREPVDCVLWVPADCVRANDYNPNVVAPPEMRLLQLSIMADGYTQPIVTWPDGDESFEVVDGFHRNRVGREVGAVRKRVRGRLPISVINPDRTSREDRMAATIRHNRARGTHRVDAMADIVLDLARRNRSDEWIAKELGMQPDEVLRLKQVTAMAELFADREFSEAWEAAGMEEARD
jgi:ParB-like chromosome segregation protein Spo0J